MQPLSPRVRAALKAEHPGLTDKVIDRVEGLLMRRTDLDPAQSPSNARAFQRFEDQRDRLIAEHMPRFADVLRRIRPGTLSDDWPSVGPDPAARTQSRRPASRRGPGNRSAR